MIQQHKIQRHSSNSILITVRNKQMVFNCSYDRYINGLAAYKNGALIQDAFQFLAPDEREFLVSGTTPEEWRELFYKEE